jgi:bifunctional non-homologous end joining protein LigD
MKKEVLKQERLQRLKPMLAQLVEEPFDDENWIFEVKFDGYRALAGIDSKGGVDLYSRNFISFTEKYTPIVNELKKFRHEVILDGEIVIEDAKGVSSFQLLQHYQKTESGVLKYYVFDLLHLDGKSTRDLPLSDRKELLFLLLKKTKTKNILFSEHTKKDGKKFFRLAQKRKLEGIIAKNAASSYLSGKRNGDWKKIKITHEQEAVIAGITEPQGARRHFGSLLLGVYHKNKFEYIGNAGSGFSESALKELYQKFKPYFISESPFNEEIKTKGKIQWMKPHLVCEVKFTEWTEEMHMRHPVYLGLHIDKKAKEVVPEIPRGRSWQKK